MVEHETILILIIGIMVFSIVLYANERFIGSGLPENIKRNLSQPIVLSVINEKLPESGILGPVEVRAFSKDDGTYLYQITATPKIKITGNLESSLDVLSIIRFKKQSIRATVRGTGGDSDKFAIGPDDGITEPIFFAELSSEIVPIQAFDGSYRNERLNSNIPVLIRSGRSAVLATVWVEKIFSIDYYENNLADYFDCRATFSLEGPCTQKFSSALNGTPGSPESEREEDIDICGGVASVKIYDKPDCTARTVNAEIQYGCGDRGGGECGQKWEEAGEQVYISFWKDTSCTRQTGDYNQLLVLCPKDRLSGEPGLTAGCLIDNPPYVAPCFR